jgi:hypothetical protein
MREQHLSDEAVAAFADGVLSGHARERARRHCAVCPGCNYAVAVQREAVWALRAAPAPSLPSGLLDRLREVPATTPITPRVPTAVDNDGTAMFATFAAPAAAFVPQHSEESGRHWGHARMTAMTVAAAAVLAGVASLAATAHSATPAQAHQAGVHRPASTSELPAGAHLARAGILPSRQR